jgi:hypothetical protein
MPPRRRPVPLPGAPARRERWSASAPRGDVARLDIPADASRARRFEIFCSLAVAHPGAGEAWHALRVLVDGAQEWSRRIATDPGGRDTLDLRFRREVPVGRALRLTAIAEVGRAVPLALSVSAEEE